MALTTPASLEVLAAMAAVWTGSHVIGAGEVLDVLLIGVGPVTLGLEVWEIGQNAGLFLRASVQARTGQDLDRAAGYLAREIATTGVDTLSAAVSAAAVRRPVSAATFIGSNN